MYQLIIILYSLIFLVFLVSGLFIVYHIVRYSFNKKAAFLMLVIFIPVFIILLISNITLFFSVDFYRIIPGLTGFQ
jgi:hypothetical protein